MTCTRCQSPMQEHHFYDFETRHGFMWMKGWRCRLCGFAADPILEANRRLGRMVQAVRAFPCDPSRTMLSVPWEYGAVTRRGGT